MLIVLTTVVIAAAMSLTLSPKAQPVRIKARRNAGRGQTGR